MKMRVKIGETEFTFHSEAELKATLHDKLIEYQKRNTEQTKQVKATRKVLRSIQIAIRELEARKPVESSNV